MNSKKQKVKIGDRFKHIARGPTYVVVNVEKGILGGTTDNQVIYISVPGHPRAKGSRSALSAHAQISGSYDRSKKIKLVAYENEESGVIYVRPKKEFTTDRFERIKHVKQVCKLCDGDDVNCDANAVWNVDLQEWVLGAVFEQAYCNTCEEYTTPVKRKTEKATEVAA